jgi:FixJ family two-component response regulator
VRDQNGTAICLLDDQPSILKGLVRLLASADLSAQPFSDPNEFLNYTKIHRSPLAVIDVWMPSMNGLEVQSRLREISPSTRVIILTAHDDPRMRSTALDAGASAFLTKPFNSEEFLTAVRLALFAS